MKNSTVLRVITLGAIAIIGIIALQSYWVVSTWDINEREFNKKVRLALYNVAKSLVELNQTRLPPRNIIMQQTSNYYVVNIETEIDANQLEYFLQKELETLALYIDFEYAVFDCSTDEMVYGNYCSYSPEGERTTALGQLPRYDEFTYYFGVKFPTRSGHLFGKMQLSIIFSVILLVTVLFFIYSMSVILRQKKLSELQKDFINNMTHEFKTPLSTMKISADVFLDHPAVKEDERLIQYANILKRQNQRLDKQVEKVLQLARMERGKFEVNPEEVDLKAMAETLSQGASARVEDMGGKLKMDLPAAPAIIRADELHLFNVINNLLDNAIKYSPRGTDIKLSLKRSGGQYLLRVEDEGPGIAPQYQKQVFEKFFRIPTGDVHDVKGFGLGLYYVKRICKAHAWDISLRSEQGKGTLVEIAIPASGKNGKSQIL